MHFTNTAMAVSGASHQISGSCSCSCPRQPSYCLQKGSRMKIREPAPEEIHLPPQLNEDLQLANLLQKSQQNHVTFQKIRKIRKKLGKIRKTSKKFQNIRKNSKKIEKFEKNRKKSKKFFSGLRVGCNLTFSFFMSRQGKRCPFFCEAALLQSSSHGVGLRLLPTRLTFCASSTSPSFLHRPSTQLGNWSGETSQLILPSKSDSTASLALFLLLSAAAAPTSCTCKSLCCQQKICAAKLSASLLWISSTATSSSTCRLSSLRLSLLLESSQQLINVLLLLNLAMGMLA